MDKCELNMKHIILKIYLLLIMAIIAIMYAPKAYSGIANTVHNLSASGPGFVYKASSETEICVFCHIPHNSKPGRPLWNRNMPNAAYTMYNSEYLLRAGYPMPTELGNTVSSPGVLSRQCLSCHDGTIAIGAVYIVRGMLLGEDIAMSSDIAENISESSTGFIGTNLSNHHPIGIKYDSGTNRGITFGNTIRPIELKPVPSSPLKLYKYAQDNYIGNYVECPSCHDPHVETQKFLRINSGNSYAENVATTCTSCHDKKDWEGSVHQVNVSNYDTVSYGNNTVATLSCTNCHMAHKGEGMPYLLRKVEENTCFMGAASSKNTAPCHGTGALMGGKDIETIISRPYGHPTKDISGVHTNLDVLYPEGGSPANSKGLVWPESKHAECFDCHNPHRAQQGVHTPSNQWYPTLPTNLVSPAIKGITGVEPVSFPAEAWSVPTIFKTLESSEKEYQICFKCHSYYALRDGDGITMDITSSGATITDQAREFNPNNKSAHPIVTELNNQFGSNSPKSLTISQMKSPWTNIGNQTMYCSDCHGADDEINTDPKGPHGSNYKYMLKGRGKHWPYNRSGKLWTLNDLYANKNNWSNDLFCANCHPIYMSGTWMNTAHRGESRGAGKHYNSNFVIDGISYNGIPCVTCHLVVPHGGNRSRLIAYGYSSLSSNQQPYIINVNTNLLRGFKKSQSPDKYFSSYCYSTHGACGASSKYPGWPHGTQEWVSGYEQ